tara:strand:+ start:1332 stop:1442 length:111 start_codon:yes stop_codon:yes gene_type:complete
MKKFVKLAKKNFLGEKNGKKTGRVFFIAVQDAERIN